MPNLSYESPTCIRADSLIQNRVDKIVGKYNTHPALNKPTKTFPIKSGPWLGNLNTNFTQGAGILTLYCSS